MADYLGISATQHRRIAPNRLLETNHQCMFHQGPLVMNQYDHDRRQGSSKNLQSIIRDAVRGPGTGFILWHQIFLWHLQLSPIFGFRSSQIVVRPPTPKFQVSPSAV